MYAGQVIYATEILRKISRNAKKLNSDQEETQKAS